MNCRSEVKVKQVIVWRHDLKVRKGKFGAQCAHASVMAVTEGELSPAQERALLEWLQSGTKKVVVRVESEEELLDIYNKARESGLICSLVRDAGHTEFHGIPTYTCCAVGPGEEDAVDRVTGHLKLM
jgi:PTH2 family peptidyl-tRNA hydrolase